MNLEKLAREAGFDTAPFEDPDGYDGGAELARFKRFAVLIVEECAKVVSDRAKYEVTDTGKSSCLMSANAIRAMLREGE